MHYFEVWKSVSSSYFPDWVVFPVGSRIISVTSVSLNVSTSHTRLLISIVALVLIWNMDMIVVPVILGALERVLTS